MHHILPYNKFQFFYFGIFTIYPRVYIPYFNSLIVQFSSKNVPHHIRNSTASSVTEQYLAPQAMPLKSSRQLKEKNLSATIQDKYLHVLNKTLTRKLNYLSFWSKYSWLENNSQLHFKLTHSFELLTLNLKKKKSWTLNFNVLRVLPSGSSSWNGLNSTVFLYFFFPLT